VQGNVGKPADVGRLFAATKDTFNRVDILVNNAGTAEFGPIEAVTTDQYRRLFDTNVLGPLLTIEEALAHFGHEGGNIISPQKKCEVTWSKPSDVHICMVAETEQIMFEEPFQCHVPQEGAGF
jgi:NAD(P)-dependent dehydrogenase (short-subunit alcohol dehydrogenase family)